MFMCPSAGSQEAAPTAVLKVIYGLMAVILMTASVTAVGQAKPVAGPRARVRETDVQIVAALKQVSAVQIRKNIEKLAGFGNRNTIGPADDAAMKRGFGIGAARQWIREEFGRYAQACGGCLEVKT